MINPCLFSSNDDSPEWKMHYSSEVWSELDLFGEVKIIRKIKKSYSKVVEIEKYHSEVVAIHLFEHILPQFESTRFRIQLQNSFFSVFF